MKEKAFTPEQIIGKLIFQFLNREIFTTLLETQVFTENWGEIITGLDLIMPWAVGHRHKRQLCQIMIQRI